MAEITPITLTEYAARRGVSKVAVSKAIAAGRLRDSVVRDGRGRPAIVSAELADREWEARTRQQAAPPAPRAKPEPRPRQFSAPPAPPADADADGDLPDYQVSRARLEAAKARRETALADVAELDAAERKGELVPVAEARAEVAEAFTLVRTKILGVPSRLAQRLPGMSSDVVPVLESLIREALEELADDGG